MPQSIAPEVVGWREEWASTFVIGFGGRGGMGPGELKKEEEGFAGWGRSEIIVLNPPVGRESARLKPTAT